MVDIKSQSKLLNYIKAFILASISGLAITVNNGTQIITEDVRERLIGPVASAIWQIRNSIHADYSTFIFTFFMFLVMLWLIPRVDRKNIKIGIPFSLIAALFALLCESYFELNSWDKLFESSSALVTSGLKGIGIATLAFFAFDFINRISIEKVSRSVNEPDAKTFFKFTLIMFACWIPYMIIMSPGAMGTDTRDQFAQILGNGDMSYTIATINRPPNTPLLNNHHPVFHTLLLGIFLKFGELIGSYFAGIELYCIVQSFVFAGALTFSVFKLREYGMSKTLLKAVYIFFTLCPLFPMWGMATFKDTPFTIILLITTILLYDAFKYPEKFDRKKYWILTAALLLLMMIRNNGFYMLLALFPFVIIHFRKDKKFLVKMVSVMLIPILIFKVGYTGIAFKVVGVTEGSPREMLSVPFQQTARYILEYEDEVTPEEEKAILAILVDDENPSLNAIAQRYVPDRSDMVKSMYNKYATKDDLIEYFKVWFTQLTKHPAVYVEAFLNLNFSWFSFESNHDIICYSDVGDRTIPEYLDGLDNPKALGGIRSAVSQGIGLLSEIPIINCIFEFSFYTWAYVILFIAMLIRKKHKELLACLPIFANYAICFVGPVAYMRYAIPMVACIPFVIFIVFSRNRSSSDEIKDISANEIWIK